METIDINIRSLTPFDPFNIRSLTPFVPSFCPRPFDPLF